MFNRVIDYFTPDPIKAKVKSVAGRFNSIKAAYSAALPSRFKRQRNRIHGTADAHYASRVEFHRIREYARDMDRNDAIIGQMIDRAVDNIVGNGFKPIPQTGDKQLDRLLQSRFNDWSRDPFQCDVNRKFSFRRIERLLLRHRFIDGDSFAIPTSDGRLQLVEGDWIDSPSNQHDGVVHGVELNDIGSPVRYWFQKPRIEDREINIDRLAQGPESYDKRPAYDRDGNPMVLHIMDPKRISQSRGVSAFAPVFDITGMFEDTNFAKLVQQQIASCVAMFIERQNDFQLGGRKTVNEDDGTASVVEELSPGLIIRGKTGETMKAFAPSLQVGEWSDHARMLVRMIGANIGMPLTLAMLDTTNTTFHGYRGELQQARLGFECVQDSMEEQFHRPVYRWLIRQWFTDQEIASFKAQGIDLFSHRWSRPGWAYIDPLTDAKADVMALENLLISPRDLHTARGRDWEDTVRETVEDRALAIRLAVEESRKIKEELDVDIDWRDLLNLKTPTGISVSALPSGQEESSAARPKEDKQGGEDDAQ